MTQLSEEGKISATILRYFNVSGADEKMRSGLMSNPDNLIKLFVKLLPKKEINLLLMEKTTILKMELQSEIYSCFRFSGDAFDCSKRFNNKSGIEVFNCGYGLDTLYKIL